MLPPLSGIIDASISVPSFTTSRVHRSRRELRVHVSISKRFKSERTRRRRLTSRRNILSQEESEIRFCGEKHQDESQPQETEKEYVEQQTEIGLWKSGRRSPVARKPVCTRRPKRMKASYKRPSGDCAASKSRMSSQQYPLGNGFQSTKLAANQLLYKSPSLSRKFYCTPSLRSSKSVSYRESEGCAFESYPKKSRCTNAPFQGSLMCAKGRESSGRSLRICAAGYHQ